VVPPPLFSPIPYTRPIPTTLHMLQCIPLASPLSHRLHRGGGKRHEVGESPKQRSPCKLDGYTVPHRVDRINQARSSTWDYYVVGIAV
jgi:hypothetical protein